MTCRRRWRGWLPKACALRREASARGLPEHDICFIHPKGNDAFPLGGEGVLIELVQAPPEVVAALGG